MSIPKPPFHTATEELLYNIYLKLHGVNSLTENDINTLAKLNTILTDADLMKAEDVLSAINTLKGDVPEAGNTLEKLFNIIQGLNYLKAEDIDTLAELNTLLSDADVLKGEDLQEAINLLKGNAPLAGNTLEKLYNLIQPVLTAWVEGGNTVGAAKSIGTKDNFPLPFITNGVERGRFDISGNLLIGHSGAYGGRLHIRAASTLEAGFSVFIDDPTINLIFGVTNSGKLFVNSGRPNLLINGGWQNLTGLRNTIITSGPVGGRLVDATHDNVVLGYNAASSAGTNPTRAISRNVVIGSEAGSSDNNGTNYSDCIYIGYKSGGSIGFNTGHRNTMVGASSGAAAPQAGTDHTIIGYDAQNARSNTFNTLLGSGTRAYNSLGDIVSNGGGQSFMTAIGAGASVRTPNTLVLGRVLNDQILVGAESNNLQLPGTTANAGFSGYKFQVIKSGGLAFGVSGAAFFRDGNLSINLGEEGNAAVKNSFRINSYINGLGGCEFLFSANNPNAALEMRDSQTGGTRPEMIRLSPVANGLFISPQQTLASNYDGYLMWLQYSTAGNNMLVSTAKPLLYIRKHSSALDGFDHTGAFLRMEENIGSTGAFIEAYKHDLVSNTLKLKFSVDKDGVVSIGQVPVDPASIEGVGRLYFVGEDLKFVTSTGAVRTVKT